MISRLRIENFALIEELETELFSGLSAVTGETGAGKSIVIEALSLALGARADKSMVRVGTERAIVTLVMDEGKPEILTREVAQGGKSLCRVDGEIVTLAAMQELAAPLADIHGQYDHQGFLIPEKHIGLLDAYGQEKISAALALTREAYAKYKDVKDRLAELNRASAASERELDFLRYEVKEIDAANLCEGEDAELETRVRVMQSGEKIYETLSRAYAALAGEADGVGGAAAAGEAAAELSTLASFGQDFAEMSAAASEARYALEELVPRIRTAMEGAEFSQKELDDALARLDQIERLKKKYGGSIADILAHSAAAKERLSVVEDSGAKKALLEQELAAAEATLENESRTLSSFRRAVAARLENAIVEQLAELNFKDARFSVAIETDEEAFTELGFDRVEFLLSANKGQPLLPLAKVASGGELSRIALAFKSVMSKFDGIETMIFDEIDSGISGITASVVGEKLLKMAKDKQVICITHLPQIAAAADRHYVLEKSADEKNTYTTMREIVGEERVREIARLLGGKNVTEKTLASAEELLRLSRGQA